jgi:hypothetical protein
MHKAGMPLRIAVEFDAQIPVWRGALQYHSAPIAFSIGHLPVCLSDRTAKSNDVAAFHA